MKVMIVDDEKPIRQWFEFILAGLPDVEITGKYSNGEQAWEACRTAPPDVIFTDIIMPVMNGIELIKAVKNTCPQVEILILSNFDDYDYVCQGMKLGASDYLLKARCDDSDIIAFIDSVRERMSRKKEDGRSRIENLIEECLADADLLAGEMDFDSKMLEQLARAIKRNPLSVAGSDADSSRGIVQLIQQYVDEHYQENIKLAVLAEKMHYHPDYLSQLFKQETGVNFNAYLTGVRIEEAKRLLATGRYKVKEVALEVGYANEMYFSTVFKNVTGMSPVSYLRKAK